MCYKWLWVVESQTFLLSRVQARVSHAVCARQGVLLRSVGHRKWLFASGVVGDTGIRVSGATPLAARSSFYPWCRSSSQGGPCMCALLAFQATIDSQFPRTFVRRGTPRRRSGTRSEPRAVAWICVRTGAQDPLHELELPQTKCDFQNEPDFSGNFSTYCLTCFYPVVDTASLPREAWYLSVGEQPTWEKASLPHRRYAGEMSAALQVFPLR